MPKKHVPLSQLLLPGEAPFLAAVVADLADDATKLVYADWLEEHGDDRAAFLRAFVQAARSMDPADFPAPKRLPEEWLELIGFRLLERVASANLPELKGPVLRLARPALRMVQTERSDRKIPVGVSKVGGLPDLPAGFSWPPGGDCHAIYNDDRGTDRLAGFLAQVNLAEVADTHAAKDLPRAGVLSFFCFQDIENDNPDAIGAKAILFPDAAKLIRTEPPKELTEGNEVMPSHRLTFQETLDVPTAWHGPWSEEGRVEVGYDAVYARLRMLNFHNVLGYARSTTGGDPTPSRHSRHLILLENAAGCRLHIQIPQDALAARDFDRITLNWVDFG